MGGKTIEYNVCDCGRIVEDEGPCCFCVEETKFKKIDEKIDKTVRERSGFSKWGGLTC